MDEKKLKQNHWDMYTNRKSALYWTRILVNGSSYMINAKDSGKSPSVEFVWHYLGKQNMKSFSIPYPEVESFYPATLVTGSLSSCVSEVNQTLFGKFRPSNFGVAEEIVQNNGLRLPYAPDISHSQMFLALVSKDC